MTSKVYNKQIGGSHYKHFKIQPSEFVIENELLYPEGCVIKYIIRHRTEEWKGRLTESKTFYRHDYYTGLSVREPSHIPHYMLLITIVCLICYLL